MRKLILCLTIVILMTGYAPAGSADPDFPDMLPQQDMNAADRDDDALIRAAVQALKSAWQEEYTHAPRHMPGEYLVDIRATRLIRIKEELEEQEGKYFGDISCIIEFLLYDDYMGSPGHGAGYHDVSRILCSVLVHRNGSLEAARVNPIRPYSARTYNDDYSLFISEVVDYGGKYNQVLTFTVR